MRSIVLAAVAALTLVCADGACAEDVGELSTVQIETLTVRVVDADSEFEVIDSRMDETATAAVLFGIVGAVVNSADNNAEDDEKAAPLVPTAEAIDLDGLIGAAITQRLASRDAVTLAQSPESASNTLLVEVGEWGLVRRAQGPDKSMRTFLKLNLSILDARGRVVWSRQREHSVGQMSAELAAFTPDVFRTEMETLATRAGQQIANRLIYR